MRRRLATVLIVLSFAAVACSDGTKTGATGTKDSKTGAGVVLLAAENTLKAGSSKIAMAADFKAEGQSFTMVGDGLFNYKTQAGTMKFKLSGDEIPEAFSGFEIRFLKSVIYMKFPDEFRQLAPNLKEWVRADVEELSEQSGFNLPGLNSFAGQDPTSALNFTRAAEDVTTVGRASVRGASTTHFRMTINLDKAVDAFPAEARSGLQKLFKDADLKELPMELWVDGSGRARRMRFALDIGKIAAAAGATGGPSSGTATITVELFEFGTPVSVSAPPAGSVSDFSELLQAGSSG